MKMNEKGTVALRGTDWFVFGGAATLVGISVIEESIEGPVDIRHTLWDPLTCEAI